MTTIFISGSRSIRRLPSEAIARLDNIINRQFQVVVGDANGVDKLIQQYLADAKYQNVRVFCSGFVCRNNLGNWDIQWITVDSRLKGRAFYTEKDKAMAAEADYGFVLWDGKSHGSLNNIRELLGRERRVLIWHATHRVLKVLSSEQNIEELLDSEQKSLVPMLNGLELQQYTAV